MAPLPGTPAASLPPPGGATPNLVAAVLLVVVTGSLVAPDPWSRRRCVLVALGGISLVLLGLLAASFSSTDIAAASGSISVATRILAVAGLLVALPIVVRPQAPRGSVAVRAMVVAASLVVVLAIVIPPGQLWPVAPLSGGRAGRVGRGLRAAPQAGSGGHQRGASFTRGHRVCVLACGIGDRDIAAHP